MKKLRNGILLLAALALLAGCAGAPLAGPIKDTETVAAGFDQAWAAALDAAQDMGLEVQAIEKASGLITFKDYNLNRYGGTFKNIPQALAKLAVKPATIFGMWDAAWATPAVTVRAAGSQTQLVVRANIKGRASEIVHEMPSRGVLEAEFFDKVRARLR